MWGADKVQRRIASVREDIRGFSEKVDRFDGALEDSGRKERPVMFMLTTNMAPAEKGKMLSNFAKNFYPIKELLLGMAPVLDKLYKIDASFKKHTGYPATWFFNPSLFYDFQYNYENLMDHIIGFPSIEKNISSLIKKEV